MQTNQQVTGIILEVGVGGKNGQIASTGHSANQHINRSGSHSLTRTLIGQAGGTLVVLRIRRKIVETFQSLAEGFEAFVRWQPREQLLADNSQ